jgi:hypothetical protein
MYMYASIDRWDDVNRLRKLMKDHGTNKMPGSSLVEIGGAMHEFLMGDKTHPYAKEVYFKLEEINREDYQSMVTSQEQENCYLTLKRKKRKMPSLTIVRD